MSRNKPQPIPLELDLPISCSPSMGSYCNHDTLQASQAVMTVNRVL